MDFQRLSSESRHNPIVAADVNPPPYSQRIPRRFSSNPCQINVLLMPFRHRFQSCHAPFAQNHRKSLSNNNLQHKYPIFRSNPIKPNQGKSCLIVPFNKVLEGSNMPEYCVIHIKSVEISIPAAQRHSSRPAESEQSEIRNPQSAIPPAILLCVLPRPTGIL
jgi:hypothetical protein